MNSPKTLSLPSIEKVTIYLTVIYIVGIMGLLTEGTRHLFLFLVPINIMAAFLTILIYQTNWNQAFISSIIIVCLGGFLIEFVGVRTGAIFGEYSYGSGLGIKLAGVPPIMGINWLVLVYGASAIAKRIVKSRMMIATIGMGLMVLYDLLLEPSAIRYQFWSWGENGVPLQNYLGWAVSAFVFIYFFALVNKTIPKNPIAEAIFWLQLVFFGGLYLANY